MAKWRKRTQVIRSQYCPNRRCRFYGQADKSNLNYGSHQTRTEVWYKRCSIRLAISLLVSVLVSSCIAPDGTLAAVEGKANGLFVVRVDRDRLTVQLKGIPLQRALMAIAQRGRVTLTLEVPLEEEATIAFDNLPLDDGVKRLLGPRSYVLGYADSGPGQPPALRVVKVLTRGHGGSEASGAHWEHGLTRWRQEAPGDLDSLRLMGTVDALASSEQSQQSLAILLATLKQGGNQDNRAAALTALASVDTLPLESLFLVALQDQEPSIRLQVLELLRERGEGDDRVKAVLLQASQADPDDTIRETAALLLEGLEIDGGDPLLDSRR